MAERDVESRVRQSRAAELRLTAFHALGRIFLYALLLSLSVLFALPLLWMASTSLKDDPQTYRVPPIWIPNPMRLQNYPEALTFLPFGHYFVNTMQIALPSIVGVLISSTLVAYAFSRIRWPGRDAVFFVCLATMMIPFQVRMIPLFLTFRTVGWINTYLPLVVPTSMVARRLTSFCASSFHFRSRHWP
jgi:multiple sugar transport system permease protein